MFFRIIIFVKRRIGGYTFGRSVGAQHIIQIRHHAIDSNVAERPHTFPSSWINNSQVWVRRNVVKIDKTHSVTSSGRRLQQFNNLKTILTFKNK